ncbi:hypothetical protein HYH02_002177 [Chlamydomonas schloesseri]|uniref:Uncharacterized protein n=1 Tax=Chlamydomonas schloesseri TaxID=2026947 RepID=A0A835WSI7_9CHLO|nr:hypothetical protein HYH02_002177 [Chlamydomonas schloesseri]|eukprot:KAG2452831.1 hypothetical protein HYH02_002177 [Chlamydomonas schloesseri]
MSCNLFAVCFGRSPGKAIGRIGVAPLEARLLPVDKTDDTYFDGHCISKSKLDPGRFYEQLAREKSCTSSGSAAPHAGEDRAAWASLNGKAAAAIAPRRKSCSSSTAAVALRPRATSDTGAFFQRPPPPFSTTFTSTAVTPSGAQQLDASTSTSTGRPRRASFATLNGFRSNQVAPAPAELRAMAAATGHGGLGSGSGGGGHQQRASGGSGTGMHALEATGGTTVHRTAHGSADQVAPILAHRASGFTSSTSVRCSRPSAAAARSRRSNSGDDPLAVALGIMRSASSETSHSRNKRASEATTTAATAAAATAERRRSTSLAGRSRSGGSAASGGGGGPPPPGTPPVLTHYPSPPRSRSCSRSRGRRTSCDVVMYSQTSSQVAELQVLMGQQSMEIPGRCRSFGGDSRRMVASTEPASASTRGLLQGNRHVRADSRGLQQQQQQQQVLPLHQQSGEGSARVLQCTASVKEETASEAAYSEEALARRRQAWLLGSCMKICRSHRRRTRSCESLEEQETEGVAPDQRPQQHDQSCPLPGLGSGSTSASSVCDVVRGGGQASGCASRENDGITVGLSTPASQSSGPPPQALLLPASEPGCVYGDASAHAGQPPLQQQSMSLSADGTCGECDTDLSQAVPAPAAMSGAGACRQDGASVSGAPDSARRTAGAAMGRGTTDASQRDHGTDSHADRNDGSTADDSEDERDAEIASVAASAVAEWRASRAASLASLASRDVSSTGSNMLDSAEDNSPCGDGADADAGAGTYDRDACVVKGATKGDAPAHQGTHHRLSWAGQAVSGSGGGSSRQAELHADGSASVTRSAGDACDGGLAQAAVATEAEAPVTRLGSSRSRRCSIAGEVVAGMQEVAATGQGGGRSLAEATSARWQQSRSLRPARSILKKSLSHAPREAHVSMCVLDDADSRGAGALLVAAPGEDIVETAAMMGENVTLAEASRGTEQRQPMPDPDMPTPPPAAEDASQPHRTIEPQPQHADKEEDGADMLMPGTFNHANVKEQGGEQLLIGADSEPFGRPPSRRNSRSPGPGDKPSSACRNGGSSAAVTSRCGSSSAQAPEKLTKIVSTTADAGDTASHGRVASRGSAASAAGTKAPQAAPDAGCGRDSRVSSCCSQAALQCCGSSGSGSSSVASHPFMTAVQQATRAATARTSLCETSSHVAMSLGCDDEEQGEGQDGHLFS